MDIFCEYLVKHKKSANDRAKAACVIAAAIMLSLITVLMLFGRIMGFEVFILAAIWYGAVFLIRKTNIEYEYILTNSILDIDKIMSKKTRKRMMSIDFKTIDVCAPADSAGVSPVGVKVLDFSGDINGKSVYYVDFSKNTERFRVFFQPNAKILDNIKKINPRLITVSQNDLV